MWHASVVPRRPRVVALALVLWALVAAACGTTLRVEVPDEAAPPPDEIDPRNPTPTPGEDPATTTDSDDDPVTSTDDSEQAFTWTEDSCAFAEPADVTASCGWLEVPERWDDPDDGDTIRLHVGIFSAGANDAEPIVYLEGGPGGDALALISQSFDLVFGTMVEHHDIVILGQRGTGSADPELACNVVVELQVDLLDETLDPGSEVEALGQAVSDCAADLREKGIDPGAYNSVQNAHDVDALRRALGHERWNVLGVSYGTRLGQTLMRLHPEGIRAAVLDSVVATQRDPLLDVPKTGKRAFDTLFDACASSSDCAERFPDLEQRFFALVDRLDAEPLRFDVANNLTGEQHPAALDGTGLVELGFNALYGKSGVAGFPELVEQLESGETSGAAALMGQLVTSAELLAAGMYWSVQCHEEAPFLDEAAAEAGRTGDERYDRLAPPESLDVVADICSALDTGAAPPVENEPVVSDIPTLLLAGVFDPITPPSDTASLLDGLAAATYVELPHTGHGAITEECGQQIVVSFLADPQADPDTSCIGDIEPPDWTPDIFADIEFEPFSVDQAFFSASGVAPVGWESLGDGTFVQGDNALHVSVILQQVVSGLPPSVFVDNVAATLDAEPVELAPVTVGDRTWSHHELVVPSGVIDLFAVDDDGETHLVLFQHAPADRDAALAALSQPILSAIGP